jgi:polysaccharide pyruvyl transferase WcaK-like protein
VGRSPEFCPDVAFALNAVEPTSLELTPSGLTLDRSGLLVGINVNGRAYLGAAPSSHRELIDALVGRLLESTEAKVLLIPHEFGSEREVEADRAILEGVGARFPGRVFALEKPLNEREVKWVIGRTHVFIGASMHACIAALSQLVPTLALTSTDKFLGVLEGAGLEDATVDLRATDTAAVIERALSLVAGRVEAGALLAQKIPEVQAQVMRAIGALVA